MSCFCVCIIIMLIYMLVDKLNFHPILTSSVPSFERELLECEKSITLKLESVHQQEMKIKIIEADFSNGIYQREIVMFGEKDNIPKELAHIKIFVKNLNKEARRDVLKGKKPFGKILSEHKMEMATRREFKNFFKVYKNSRILNYVASEKDFFYGRNYFIFLIRRFDKKKLAEVTEIFL